MRANYLLSTGVGVEALLGGLLGGLSLKRISSRAKLENHVGWVLKRLNGNLL
jgi:hypothetical protein